MKTIFISSTFRDMNAERDLFHTRIGPDLNAIARDYGDSISFCDLRWGVDTTQLDSEIGAQKVLSVCLNEIDRCKPYMIVLLGERYGWIPSQKLIAQAAGTKNMQLDSLEKSITALEIEYGALKNPDRLDHTLFYFREIEGSASADYRSEDSYHARKLQELKQRILRLSQGRVKSYRVQWDEKAQRITGLDDFCAMVTSDLRLLLQPGWEQEKNLTPYQRDQRMQWEFCMQKAAQFSSRYDLIEQYKDLLRSGTNRLALRGPAGIGKSTLLSQLALSLETQVLPIFCGTSAYCTSSMAVVQYLVDYLETVLKKTHFRDQKHPSPPDIYKWRQELDSLAAEYNRSTLPPLTIVIDAVDQLSPERIRDELQFIPSKTFSRIQIVLSFLDSFPLPKNMAVETVPDLKDMDRICVLRKILEPTGRALAEEVLHAMAAKEGCNSPLYLSLLVNRLEMMDQKDYDLINRQGGGMEQINLHQMALIDACPTDLDGLCADILDTAAANLESDLPQAVVNFLAVSRHGLREQDLCDIFWNHGIPWDALVFSRFRQYLSRFFVLYEDGRLDFSHKSFRTGLRKRLKDIKFYHTVLCNHMERLPEKDPLREAEIMYHVIWSDNDRNFTEYVYDCFGSPNQIPPVAQLVADRIRRNGGEWICRILCGNSADLDYPMVHFITHDVFSAFSEKEDRRVLRSVMEQTLFLAEQLPHLDTPKPPDNILRSRFIVEMPYWADFDDRTLKWLHTNALNFIHGIITGVVHCKDSRDIRRCRNGFFYASNSDRIRLLAFTLDRLAQLWAESDLQEDQAKALACFIRSEALYRSLLQESPADIHGLLVCMNLYSQAMLHEKAGGSDSLEKAEVCCRDMAELAGRYCNHLAEETQAHAYHRLGELQVRRFGKFAPSATKFYILAIEKWEALLNTPRESRSFNNQNLHYSGPEATMIELHLRRSLTRAIGSMDPNIPENRHVLSLFHERLTELWEKDYHRRPDTRGKLVVCTTWENAAAFFAKSSEQEDIRKALSYCVKSLPLRQELNQELHTAASMDALANLFERISSLYERSGYQNNLPTAEKMMECAVIYRRMLLRQENTPVNRQNLGFSLNRRGLLLYRMGDSEQLIKSLECYTEALEIRQNLAIELNTNRVNDDLIVTLVNISCLAAVPREQKSVYLHQALTLSQTLLKKTNNPRYRSFMERITAQLQKLSQ